MIKLHFRPDIQSHQTKNFYVQSFPKPQHYPSGYERLIDFNVTRYFKQIQPVVFFGKVLFWYETGRTWIPMSNEFKNV